MKTVDFVCIPLALIASACAPSLPVNAPLEGAELVARGEYLVNGLLGCNDCHTPMTPEGPDMSQALQGANLVFAPMIDMPWAPHAPALAGLPDGYDETQLAHLLQSGEKSTGGMALPPMPQFRLNPDDARAATAYIASLPRPD